MQHQTHFARDWLRKSLCSLNHRHFTELTGEDLLIKFVVQKDQDTDDFELPPPITQAKNNEHYDSSARNAKP